MSDTQTGGDGSVRWSIDADSVKEHASTHEGNGRLKHTGIDKTGHPGDPFTVSIRVPSHFKSVAEYLRALTDPNSHWGVKAAPGNEQRVYFNIPIERMTPDQIRVSWGNSINVVRHDETT